MATAETPTEKETRFDFKLWRRFFTIAKPYWLLDRKRFAWGMLLTEVALLLSITGLAVWLNRQLGEMTSALAAQESGRFWGAVLVAVLLLVFTAPLTALYYYVRDRLTIDWRAWLTNRFIESYFSNRAFYRLTADDEIDNPDQRIAQDIDSFTQSSLYFLLIIFEQLLQLIAFSGVLWAISQSLVYFLILYALVGTLVTTIFFGKALIGLNYFQLQREGDLRYRLVRVRENAESIALYRGEPTEIEQLKDSMQRGYLNYHKLIGMQLRLNLFQYGYSSLTDILPAVIIANQVLSGDMEVGRLVQATGAFTTILKAVSLIIDKFDALSKFAAGIDRLDDFATALARQTGGRKGIRMKYTRSRTAGIVLSHVTVMTPDRARTLVRDLNLTIKPGDSLLIVGTSGGGKSSLLRAIAGLWNSGEGYIRRPHPKQMLFLSQRSYMVVGTLRNQLFYPLTDNPRISDVQLQATLAQVNLPDLAERIGGFNAEVDWSKTLSLGEQQRVAFARALLASPRFLVLDEATSALDIENEEHLYRLISNLGITLLSISHRPTTLKFHQQVLELQGEGGWELFRAENYRFDESVAAALES